MNLSSLSTSEFLRILDVARHMAEQRMVQPLVEYVAATVFEIIPAERCMVVLFADDGSLQVPVGRTQAGALIPNPTDQLSSSILQQVRAGMAPIRVADALDDELLKSSRSVRSLGLRSVLCVPLVSHDKAVGAIYAENRRAGRQFEESDLMPLVLLASQVVVALENARMVEALETTVAERTRALSETLANLRAAQNQLIQSEKMAALGNLVAGVAHELRNPLNFVTNLARLSIDLVSELELLWLRSESLLDLTTREEYLQLLTYLHNNCQEIYANGQRADAIISMMLLHTRSDTSQFQPLNLNDLIKQSLNLSYHSLRSRKPDSHPITFDLQLRDGLPQIMASPQGVGQVLINLIDNACYALWEREQVEPSHQPVLRISSEQIGDRIVVRVWDNGVGIPPHVLGTIFDPFVTSKPPGEGTGLGLSLTYDILVNGHGGSIEVASEPLQYTEFTLSLPIKGVVSRPANP